MQQIKGCTTDHIAPVVGCTATATSLRAITATTAETTDSQGLSSMNMQLTNETEPETEPLPRQMQQQAWAQSDARVRAPSVRANLW